ncbi:DUF3050 domain-containing protein [Pseudobacteriovorax antillogorgiicola]|uniref:DUF3050 domain-containing protein n=1 Tax=Pseudobacteriovorax antillogorgiicola TaxID=1513793 RepID=A0A1Y6CSF8_9BACT|nr:DUF3050 domain-containing protein [Pseudobacteriovorax antillogorgiicola]TCS46181.1 DUF3050 family protein [Pseudobacteriovorax antillogorgiicola]SMF70043.1 Protein of unknown function [Pseudobacteriovorax antillogorgiicola]
MISFETKEHTKKLNILEIKLETIQKELADHTVYHRLFNRQNLRTFMEYHVFAVWDFMTILKALQIKLTCTTIPWKPSMYPKELVRFVNEIVLDEESDLDHNNQPCDHFSMYVRAMDEIHADTKPIKRFLKNYDYDLLKTPLKEFVQFNINIASNYPIHIVAGVFFFGREKIIPDIFRSILNEMKTSSSIYEAPALVHYLKRHVDLDEQEHGPIARRMLRITCNDSPKAYQEALSYGIQACLLRKKLFDKILHDIDDCVVTEPLAKLRTL